VKSAAATLELENDALRALFAKLGRIVLTSVDSVPSGFGGSCGNIRAPVFESLTPEQIVSELRDLALECERLVRISKKSRRTQDLDAIGTEFADMAERMESAFRISVDLR